MRDESPAVETESGPQLPIWPAVVMVLAAGALAAARVAWFTNVSERTANAVAVAETLCVYFACVMGCARASRSFARGALAVFIAVPLLSLVYPYDFGQTEANVLMKILQYQDPSLFQTDLTMQSTRAVGGYNFFSRLCSICPYAAMPVLFYFSWLVCLGFIGWFFRRVFEDHFGSRHGVLLSYGALVVLGLTYKWQKYGGFILGDNDLTYNWLRHQSLAWALCLWALDAYFRRRWIMFGLLAGMVINVHINTGQHLLLLIAADWIVFNRAETRRVLGGLCVAALVSSITLGPVLWHEVLHAPAMRVEHGFTLVAGYFRHPFHFIPSSWSPVLYAQYGLFLVVGTGCWVMKRPKTRLDFRLLGMVMVSLLGLAAGYVFVELIPVDLITETQLARMTIFTKVIFLLYILNAAGRFVPRATAGVFAGRGRQLAAAAIVLAFASSASMRHYVIDPPRTPLQRFFLEQTEPTATVMLPPAFGFDHFGERTLRSVAVNMKVFPFARPWYLEYYERLMALGGMTAIYDRDAIRNISLPGLIRDYNRLPEETLLALCRKWGCGYIIRDRRAIPLLRSKLVFEDGYIAVYKTPSSSR